MMPTAAAPNDAPPATTVAIGSTRFCVLSSRHEVMFRDGTMLGLHMVTGLHGPELLLRALRTSTDWIVFDLRHVAGPEIEDDLKRLDKRDRPGCVMYTLRGAFPSAEPAVRKMHEQTLARLPPAPWAEAA